MSDVITGRLDCTGPGRRRPGAPTARALADTEQLARTAMVEQ